MKREYTKPTIEGETFVANEYVAACYIIKVATGRPGQTTTINVKDPTFDKDDKDGDGYGIYHGQYKYYNYSDGYMYSISSVKKDQKSPNASN